MRGIGRQGRERHGGEGGGCHARFYPFTRRSPGTRRGAAGGGGRCPRPPRRPLRIPPWSAARMASIVVAILLFGCQSSSMPCETSRNCPADHACVDGECRERTCLDNSDCAVESHCDAVLGQCVRGCQSDGDCPYGETCSGATCEARKCLSSNIDCDVGQYCDVGTGECFDAAGLYCAPCSDTTYSSDCGGGGNLCRYLYGNGPFCFPSCEGGLECPAGYSCIPLSAYGDVVTYVCVTLCDYIEQSEDLDFSVDKGGAPLQCGSPLSR